MKLYTYDAAPNPQRLALFLKLKGVEIETQQVDMANGEQLTEEYIKILQASKLKSVEVIEKVSAR